MIKVAAAGLPGEVEWIELDEPTAARGELVLRPLACGICTTDVKLVRAGYQGGPRYALGHELVGQVVEAGDGARWQVGDQVVAVPYIPCGGCEFCLAGKPTLCTHLYEKSLMPGGLAERVHVPQPLAERGVFALPSGMSVQQAALAEPIGCCVQGVEDCGIGVGARVLVVGDGPMGLMCAAVARVYGASQIIVSGMIDWRLQAAEKHYADAIVDVTRDDLVETVKRLTGGHGVDAVLVAVSSAEAVQDGLSVLRPGGVLNAFAGVPKGTTVALDLRQLHYQQIHLTGSFGVGPYHVAQALKIMSSRQLALEPLVTRTFSFEQTADAVQYAMNHEGFKAVVVFDQSTDRERDGE